jgi:DNA-binding Xre family transcriptional regulator
VSEQVIDPVPSLSVKPDGARWASALSAELSDLLRLRQSRLALEGKRLTQKEIAERTGLTILTVTRYMDGERLAPIDALDALCEVLGADVEDVVRRARGRMV